MAMCICCCAISQYVAASDGVYMSVDVIPESPTTQATVSPQPGPSGLAAVQPSSSSSGSTHLPSGFVW